MKESQQPIAGLNRRLARLSGVVAGVDVLSGRVAAQSVQELGSVLCGTGVGQLIGLVFIAAAIYYLLKALLKGMDALDKMGSTQSKQVRAGKDKFGDAGQTALAAFVPAIAAGVFEILGVNTVSCLDPSAWTIIGVVVALPV